MSYRDHGRVGIQGDDASLVLVNRETGAKTTPGSCKSDTLFLEKEAQAFHANADGTVAITSPPLPGSSVGKSATYQVVKGQVYSYRAQQIKATGTTLAAADIVLLYAPY